MPTAIDPSTLSAADQAALQPPAQPQPTQQPIDPSALSPQDAAVLKAHSPVRMQDLSADDMAELNRQDPKGSSIIDTFNSNPKVNQDPAMVQKFADAYDKYRNTPLSQKLAPVIKHPITTAYETLAPAVTGFGKWFSNVATGVPHLLTAAAAGTVGNITGNETLQQLSDLEAQAAEKPLRENYAALESGATGLGETAVNLAKKGALDLLGAGVTQAVFGPEDKLKNLYDAAAMRQQNQEILKGKGELPGIKEATAEQGQLSPERVANIAAGEPTTWIGMGKAFEAAGAGAKTLAAGVPGAETLAKVLPKAGQVEQAASTAAGLGVQAAAKGGKAAAAVVKAAAPLAGGIKGAMTHGPLGAYAGYELGSKVAEKAGTVGTWFNGIDNIGRQMTGAAPMTSRYAQLGSDIAASIPSVIGSTAKGAAFDLGLAATADTPDQAQSFGFGTGLGLLGGITGLGRRTISGQLIAPRFYGQQGFVPSSGSFPALDAMHNAAMKSATPGVQERLNAVRDFTGRATGSPDVYLANNGGDLQKALVDSGMDPTLANQYAQQQGIFKANLNGKPVILARDVDSAPHEAFHAVQNVLGEGANQRLDNLVKSSYGDQWENMGQDYANRLGDANGRSWRAQILDASGWGSVAAMDQLYRNHFNRYAAEYGMTPDPDVTLKYAQEDWQRAVDNARANNPGYSDTELNQMAWRDVLSGQDANKVADSYLAREIAAEHFDALFKNQGSALAPNDSVPGKLANVAGKLISAVGGNPLAGRTSEGLNVPLQQNVSQAVREAALSAVPTVNGEQAPPAPSRPVVAPRGPGGMPVTPQQQEDAVTEARTIADNAPSTPVAGGTQSQREILGSIAEAMANNQGVKLNYLSAPDEPAAAATSNRTNRRSIIETFRNMPAAARALWEKTFFPNRVVARKGGKYQIFGWSPEVFASNAHKLANTLADIQAKNPGATGFSPYEVDPATKSFTPDAWRQLYTDVQTFVKNQMGGRTGSGRPLVVPADAQAAGAYAPPLARGGGALDQRRSDFINMLFNSRLPDTARITSGKMPLNVLGQQVSEATIPGRVAPPVRPRPSFAGEAAEKLGISGQPIQEVNPVRNEFETLAQQNGVVLPSFIEANQLLNLENIKQAEAAPEAPQFRGNTLTLAAGFMPSKDPNAIRSAAIRTDDGKIFEGHVHAFAHAAAGQAYGPGKVPNFEEGYTTNSGEFLNRQQAFDRAQALKQYTPTPTEQRMGTRSLEAMNLNRQTMGKEESDRRFVSGLQSNQFLPSTHPDAVRTAAVREDSTGKTWEGPMHAMAILNYLQDAGKITDEASMMQAWNSQPGITEGYLTHSGEFLDREQAYDRAVKLGQYRPNILQQKMGDRSLESEAFNRQQETAQALPKKGDEFTPSGSSMDLLGKIHAAGYQRMMPDNPDYWNIFYKPSNPGQAYEMQRGDILDGNNDKKWHFRPMAPDRVAQISGSPMMTPEPKGPESAQFMHSLEGIKKMNDEEVARQRRQSETETTRLSSYNGDAQSGLVLHSAKQRNTVFIPPGDEAKALEKRMKGAKSPQALNKIIEAQFKPTSPITVVRHGETDRNVEPERIRGWDNVPLNATGKKQAEDTAQKLKDHDIQHIFASNLDRTMDTARALAKTTGADVTPDAGLRPWNMGDFHGKPVDEVMPKMQEYLDNPNKKVPGGESFNEFKDRFLNAYKRISETAPGAAIVTHFRNTKLLDSWHRTGVDNHSIDMERFRSPEGGEENASYAFYPRYSAERPNDSVRHFMDFVDTSSPEDWNNYVKSQPGGPTNYAHEQGERAESRADVAALKSARERYSLMLQQALKNKDMGTAISLASKSQALNEAHEGATGFDVDGNDKRESVLSGRPEHKFPVPDYRSTRDVNFGPDAGVVTPPYTARTPEGKSIADSGLKLIGRKNGDYKTLYAFEPGNQNPVGQVDIKDGNILYSKEGPVQKALETEAAQYMPKRKEAGDEWKLRPGNAGFSKAWISPEGEIHQLGGKWHHDWLNENPDVKKKYGITSSDEQKSREQALKAGFARVNYDQRSGKLTVEAREKDWPNQMDAVRQLAGANLDKVDSMAVHLTDAKVKAINNSETKNLFDIPREERLDNLPMMGGGGEVTETSPQASLSSQGAEGGAAPVLPSDFQERLNANLKRLRDMGIQAKPGGLQNNEDFAKEISRLRNTNEGQTFNPDGSIWNPGKKDFDVVSLASVNVPAEELTPQRVREALAPYEDVLGKRGAVAGIFPFEKDGKKMFSIDVNAAVPQEHRGNTMRFAKDNDQIAIWDAKEGETVPTGGQGNTRLTDPEEMSKALTELRSGRDVNITPDNQVKLRPLTPAEVKNMSRQDFLERYPEAVVPKEREEEISSDLTNAPLLNGLDKKKDDAARVKRFADSLYEDAQKYKDTPEFQAGIGWYDRFSKMLKDHFGDDAQIFAELLAATSPNTKVDQNFKMATEAYVAYKQGLFNRHIKGLGDGIRMLEDGSWKKWAEDNNVKRNKAGEHTEAKFMAKWIAENDLLPRKSNGAKFGMNSKATLQVLARMWLGREGAGLKTNNFVQNLVGTGHGATIDMWADRTLRRLGYEPFQERWRILPLNITGIPDKDFTLGQKVYADAAARMGLKPQQLQAAMWFAEKQLWHDKGWGKLDLGDYAKELPKYAGQKAQVEARLAARNQ